MAPSGPGSVPPPDDDAGVIARLRERVTLERQRAARAEAIAAGYEARSAAGPECLRSPRARMAVLHRQMQTCHRTSAALHEAHAIRMEAWADGRGPAFRPVFMSAVAAAMGAGSAAATLRGRRPAAVVTAASDGVARAAHDLEIALGEGPAVTVMSAGVPVSAVGGSLPDRWPLYGPAIGELGVRAVVAVPLFGEIDYQAIVHQAAGMVAVQFGCGIDDAEHLLRARAFADDQPVEEVALSVLRRQTRLN